MTDDLSEWYETARQMREAFAVPPSIEHTVEIQWRQLKDHLSTDHTRKRSRDARSNRKSQERDNLAVLNKV